MNLMENGKIYIPDGVRPIPCEGGIHMNEWTMVTVIVALVGLITAIVTPIVKLNTSLTRLNTAVQGMEKDMEHLKQTNRQEQEELWEVEKVQDETLVNLKIRLAVLEKGH